MENESLKLATKQEQAELLHRVLASTDEDAMEERLPTLPDDVANARRGTAAPDGAAKRRNPGAFAGGAVRRAGQMASLSGADHAIYVDTSSAAKRDKLKDRHPLFRFFRR